MCEALNKGLKKDDKGNKVVKYNNNLMYNFVHNFIKYSMSNFNEIPSLDSKFDTLNKFYNDFKKWNVLKVKPVKQSKKKKNKTKKKCTKKCTSALR